MLAHLSQLEYVFEETIIFFLKLILLYTHKLYITVLIIKVMFEFINFSLSYLFPDWYNYKNETKWPDDKAFGIFNRDK